MKFYYAPLEGVTGYIYRNAYHKFFSPADKYFAPFIVANLQDGFKTRDIQDILPDNNASIKLIPQLLSNNADYFIHTSKRIKEFGYEEINLNLGCPSGTVVAKYKGSGFLAKPKELDDFLDKIYSAGITDISVKTRLGKEDPEEFYHLIEIYNKYPLKELIIHPRIQKDFYKNTPRLEVFNDALELSKNPVCYNGDINKLEDYESLKQRFPSVDTIMIGRGLIRDPFLIEELKGKKELSKETLKEFHDTVYMSYRQVISGDRNVLFKMKEIWIFMIDMFTDNTKYLKKIKKSENAHDYEEAINSLFRDRELISK
ncbi:MAG: tRNA-dihydrouridine synthase [Anaerocolumna sp.]|jgi:tRNA-dihydrouridine synthase|nr:tRNA-dihydrouridine synthase [Anaerocolumna sp.]